MVPVLVDLRASFNLVIKEGVEGSESRRVSVKSSNALHYALCRSAFTVAAAIMICEPALSYAHCEWMEEIHEHGPDKNPTVYHSRMTPSQVYRSPHLSLYCLLLLKTCWSASLKASDSLPLRRFSSCVLSQSFSCGRFRCSIMLLHFLSFDRSLSEGVPKSISFVPILSILFSVSSSPLYSPPCL